MTPTLRDATADDIDAIHSIYAHHVRHGTGTFELDPPSVSEMHRRFQELAGRDCPFLVAEVADEVVGYGYVGPFRERRAYRYTVEDSIYLHPDQHGRGIGSQLLERLIDGSRERGYTQMIAMIGDSANRASVALHAKLGFETTGTLRDVGFKFDRWLDVVIMQRSLRQG